MARRTRKNLGSSGEGHFELAKAVLANAKLDASRVPPNCQGAIPIISRALEANAEARAHLWSMPQEMRAEHSALFGDVNKLDKKLRGHLMDAQFNCVGRLTFEPRYQFENLYPSSKGRRST